VVDWAFEAALVVVRKRSSLMGPLQLRRGLFLRERVWNWENFERELKALNESTKM